MFIIERFKGGFVAGMQPAICSVGLVPRALPWADGLCPFGAADSGALVPKGAARG